MENIFILTNEFIDRLLSDSDISVLEFTKRPTENFWKTLNKEVLSKRKDLELRLYGNINQEWKDLSFVSDLYHLQKLSIDENSLCSNDLNPLSYIENLVELSIGENIDIDNALSLKPIKKFKEMRSLTLAGNIGDIHVISEFHNLNKLGLYDLKEINEFDFLSPLKKLYSLKIVSCPIRKIDSLTEVNNLRYLELDMIPNLKEIKFLNSFTKLEYLSMSELEVSEIPNLDNCTKLGRVSLDRMIELRDISNLYSVISLEELAIYDGINFIPNQFVEFKNHDSIKVLHIEFNDDEKSAVLRQLFSDTNIEFRDRGNKKYLALL